MKKYTCFVISPIGDEGTEIYEEYKDLYELIIVPALEVYDISVSRGDHFVSDEKIDSSVIRNIQDADICICDISMPNPNVYYELGRRDETGKPVLLLKKKGTNNSPVDIATRRFFEYDWDSKYSIREAQGHIRSWVDPLIEQGFDTKANSASLADIADAISRLERKIDRMTKSGGGKGTETPPGINTEGNPVEKLSYALMTENIPMGEEAMDQLQYRMEKLKFYDQVVEQVALMGSNKAGDMLIQMAEEFFDSDMSLKKKIEYLGCLVGFANRTDREQEVVAIVENACEMLDRQLEGYEDMVTRIQTHNQRNRLYHGLYRNTKDIVWLEKAIKALNEAIDICPADFLYYNLGICQKDYMEASDDMEHGMLAKEAIEKTLELDAKNGKENKDHYKLACQIYHMINDPALGDMMERFAQVDPLGAAVLSHKFGDD